MSPAETFRLCIKGVRHRLLRSMLTLAVVVLAVAFFMFLLAESMFQRATAQGVLAETKHERLSQHRLTRFLSPATEAVAVRRLADAWKAQDVDQLDEFAAVVELPREQIDSLAAESLREVEYAAWLAGIPAGKRTVLIHKTSGRDAFAFIIADLDGFRSRLKPMVDIKVPDGLEAFEGFLSRLPSHQQATAAFTAAWNAKVEKAAAALVAAKAGSDQSDADWIIDAPEEATERWRAELVALGFDFDSDALVLMRQQLRATRECADVHRTLNSREIREAWMREYRENTPSTAEQKIPKLTEARAVKLFEGIYDADLLKRVAEKTLYEQKLMKLERRLALAMASEGGFLGLDGRQVFLLAISFMVCMVGIANAMLMSITERFREIATMKCLGATDSYILMQFMMEAGMQGFFGGLLGVVIGFVIATTRGFMAMGSHLAVYWPWGDLAICSVVSLLAGVLLAMLASIQPSWSASRMAPMEAMRVE
ncbi:MAG: ABC transporter permease [Kiritimatiellia bacterium]|uniref:ABC transporter permease n=1 Tax=Atribacter sp. TaxID=2847780 RepID=UPI003D96D87C